MENYVGEIRLFAGNFAPVGWRFCNGDMLSIAENEALFALIGTTYGGDGVTTFRLPDLQSRVPVHMGTPPATGTTYSLGQKGGAETQQLTVANLPPHQHPVMMDNGTASENTPSSSRFLASTATPVLHSDAAGGNVTMAPQSVTTTGSGHPFSIQMPCLTVNFIIALYGLYPSRS